MENDSLDFNDIAVAAFEHRYPLFIKGLEDKIMSAARSGKFSISVDIDDVDTANVNDLCHYLESKGFKTVIVRNGYLDEKICQINIIF